MVISVSPKVQRLWPAGVVPREFSGRERERHVRSTPGEPARPLEGQRFAWPPKGANQPLPSSLRSSCSEGSNPSSTPLPIGAHKVYKGPVEKHCTTFSGHEAIEVLGLVFDWGLCGLRAALALPLGVSQNPSITMPTRFHHGASGLLLKGTGPSTACLGGRKALIISGMGDLWTPPI